MPVRGIVVFMDAVHENELLQPVEQQKADDECNHRQPPVAALPSRQLEDLWQQVERHHPEKDSGGEAEDHVQPVSKPQRA